MLNIVNQLVSQSPQYELLINAQVLLSPFGPYRPFDGPKQRRARLWEFCRRWTGGI
jgi:hypothetical protein